MEIHLFKLLKNLFILLFSYSFYNDSINFLKEHMIMDCKERGLLPESQYFFFSPSDSFLEHNYGVTNCGYFICRFNYAKIILKSTDNSISQITDMLG